MHGQLVALLWVVEAITRRDYLSSDAHLQEQVLGRGVRRGLSAVGRTFCLLRKLETRAVASAEMRNRISPPLSFGFHPADDPIISSPATRLLPLKCESAVNVDSRSVT